MEEKTPISTPLTPISSQIRRLLATSRIGTIIARRFKNRYAELYVVVPAAVLVLSFCGYSAQGHATFLSGSASSYFEDFALAADVPSATSGMQSAYISGTLATDYGGDESAVESAVSPALPTDHDSILALTTADEDYLDALGGESTEIIEYTVQPDDLLSFIAADFGVSVNTIIWANKLKDADSISPGQILRIPPVTGVIAVVPNGATVASLAKKYSADEDRIIAYNRLPQGGVLEAGVEIIIPDGKVAGLVSAQPAVTGNASTARVAASTKQFAHLPDLGNYFMNPSTGINWGRIHGRNGVDEANSCGTPVYAAADGVVTLADAEGYNGGFGKYIKISHPNGTETLYAHSSKLFASIGQTVAKGQKIMLIGNTGRVYGATGCHLHFEVHGARNPLAKS